MSQPGQDKVAASVSIDNGDLFMSLIKPNNLSYSIANYSYLNPDHLSHGQHLIFIDVTETDSSRAFEFQGFYIEKKAASSKDMARSDSKDGNIGHNINCSSKRRVNFEAISVANLVSIVGISLLLLAIFCMRRVWSRKLASSHDNLCVLPETPGSTTSLAHTGNELGLIIHKSPRIARPPEAATLTQSATRKIWNYGRPPSSSIATPSDIVKKKTIHNRSESSNETTYDPFYHFRESSVAF